MTCGACEPESFRTKPNKRTHGYVVAANPLSAATDAQRLHYLGAELVLVDQPKGQLAHRPGFSALRRITRAGDTIILARMSCLGTKPDRAEINRQTMEAEGLTIQVMNHDYFERVP